MASKLAKKIGRKVARCTLEEEEMGREDGQSAKAKPKALPPIIITHLLLLQMLIEGERGALLRLRLLLL